MEGLPGQILDEARNVARVGDQHVHGALLHAHQRVHRQREDVVERQRADIGEMVGLGPYGVGVLHPQRELRDIGQHVAVQQRGPLRHAGGAARILQEGHVGRHHLHRLEVQGGALPQRGGEAHMPRQRPSRHQLLHAAHHEVDEHALQAAQHLAHRGDHDMLDLRAGRHGLQGGGEILQDDDGLGAGILELVLQLARRVERVDVDHDIARPQHGHHGQGILQHVGHHQRHARALLQPARLQERAEGRRHALDLGIGERLAHAGEGGARGILPAGGFQQLADRTGRQRADLGRHARRIAGQPGLGRHDAGHRRVGLRQGFRRRGLSGAGRLPGSRLRPRRLSGRSLCRPPCRPPGRPARRFRRFRHFVLPHCLRHGLPVS